MGKFLKRYRLLKDDQREKWLTAVRACAKSLQSCLALCNPMDCSLPSSCPWDSPGKNTDLSHPRIEPTSPVTPALTDRFFTTVATRKACIETLSYVWLFETPPWTIQSMAFSRPECWSGWPFPSPGDLPNLGIKPSSPALKADSLTAEPQGSPLNHGCGCLKARIQVNKYGRYIAE